MAWEQSEEKKIIFWHMSLFVGRKGTFFWFIIVMSSMSMFELSSSNYSVMKPLQIIWRKTMTTKALCETSRFQWISKIWLQDQIILNGTLLKLAVLLNIYNFYISIRLVESPLYNINMWFRHTTLKKWKLTIDFFGGLSIKHLINIYIWIY